MLKYHRHNVCGKMGESVMRRLIVTLLTLTIGVLACAGVSAQEETAQAGEYKVDLSPPDLAAFTLLGINSNNVARPASVKELAFAFMNAGGEGSDIVPNVAIEWSPGETFAAKDLAFYRLSRWWRAMQLSFATGKDSLGTSMGFGWRWVPVDKTDPSTGDKTFDRNIEASFRLWDGLRQRDSTLVYLTNQRFIPLVRSILTNHGIEPTSVEEKIFDVYDALPETSSISRADADTLNAAWLYDRLVDNLDGVGVAEDSLSDDEESELLTLCREYSSVLAVDEGEIVRLANAAVKRAKEDFKQRSWNAMVIHVALGAVWTSFDGTWGGLRTNYFRGYVGMAYPVGSFGQIIGHLEFDKYERDDAIQDRAWSAGVRSILGGSDFRGTGEFFFRKVDGKESQFDEEKLSLKIGTEIKIHAGLWLELGIGSDLPTGEESEGRILTLANLKYSLNPSARTKLPSSN